MKGYLIIAKGTNEQKETTRYLGNDIDGSGVCLLWVKNLHNAQVFRDELEAYRTALEHSRKITYKMTLENPEILVKKSECVLSEERVRSLQLELDVAKELLAKTIKEKEHLKTRVAQIESLLREEANNNGTTSS